MAQQNIDVGTTGNDGTGDPLREAGQKINSNFTELYSFVYTDEDARDALGTALTAGSNISISVDDGNDTITISSVDTNTQLTAEQVEDMVGSMVTGNTETLITVTYDDVNGKLNFVVDQASLSITESQISDLGNYATVGANISIFNNDSGYITGYTVTQADVTQHQGALQITESQITDLSHYTDEQARDAIGTALTAGSNITINVDDGANTITISATSSGSSLTTEEVQDIVGGMITGNTETLITVTYDDTAGVLNFVVDEGSISITESQISDLGSYVESGANISVFTNDAGYITGYTVTENDVTQHQAALSLTESQITDLGNYIASGANISLLTNDAGYITGYTVTEADVTSHEGAITITQSQISDLYANDPVQTTGTEISFGQFEIYNTADTPATGTITQDLSGAQVGITQKIYHSDGAIPSFPADWVKLGNTTYTTGQINIIYAEYVAIDRIEYWIVK